MFASETSDTVKETPINDSSCDEDKEEVVLKEKSKETRTSVVTT